MYIKTQKPAIDNSLLSYNKIHKTIVQYLHDASRYGIVVIFYVELSQNRKSYGNIILSQNQNYSY